MSSKLTKENKVVKPAERNVDAGTKNRTVDHVPPDADETERRCTGFFLSGKTKKNEAVKLLLE
jgi:hypothetical protein